MSLTETPRANRIHIGIFGKRNSGKSSLINAITSQKISLVSSKAGTTTDPVYKAMELFPIGPVVFIDTAGFDDVGDLGTLRVEKTEEVATKTDIGIVLFSDIEDLSYEKRWIEKLRESNTPIISVINKADILTNQIEKMKEIIAKDLGLDLDPIIVSAKTGEGISEIKNELSRISDYSKEEDLIKGLADKGDLVLLVMPQDIQAPKGRLILPQVQTIRSLLDKGCIVISTTLKNLEQSIDSLKFPPKLIITDSQCFNSVYEKKPKESLLTSFSILFAADKGDIEEFVKGANAIDNLNGNSKVLIAEACTHAPLSEDIGRVKIPRILKEKFGESINISIVSGVDFPKDVSEYDLIIHCGACMFNRKYMLDRIKTSKKSNVNITNYGVALAKLNGILDKIVWKDI